MHLTDKQHQVLAAVAAGIVRHEVMDFPHNRWVVDQYFVGKENVTSVVRALRYRGLIKGNDRLELVT